VQSNMAAVVVTALAGVTALRGRPESLLLSSARATIACFLLVAGIVFALLVSQGPSMGYRIDVPWSDAVLHFVLPAFVLVDWLVSPGRRMVSWRIILIALAYPTVWGIGTIIRGEFVGWYPYFFLDPAQAGYPGTLVIYSAASLALFAIIAAGLVAASHVAPLGEKEPPGTGYRRSTLRARRLRGRARRRAKRAAVTALRRTGEDSR